MRFAYVGTTVHPRSALQQGPVDVEWLLAMSGDHDVLVFVDEETAEAEALRGAGIPIFVSAKREVFLPDGAVLSADAAQARLAAQAHLDRPLDLLLYGAGVTTDLAWFERDLASVPRGVALGGGMIGAQRLILTDPSLFQYFGRSLWSTTGFIAGADFILGNAPADQFGFKPELLPPQFATTDLSQLGRPRRPRKARASIVVVATTDDAVGLGNLIPRVTERVPVDPITSTLIVVHGDHPVGRDNSQRLILDGVPADLERNVILAAPGWDGVAAAFLEKADLVVASRPADLAIPAVTAAAAANGYVLLEGALTSQPVLSTPPARRTAPSVVMVPVHGSPGEFAEMLARLDADGTTDAVVFHTPDFGDEAFRLVGMPGLAQADLTVLAAPEITYGTPDPRRPCTHVLGAARSSWPSLRRRLTEVGSLEELVIWSLGLSLVEHTRLLLLPGSGEGCEALPIEDVPGLPTWITSNGILEKPSLAAIAPPTPPPPPGESVRAWAQTVGWKQRTRLALPWRWGLLERSMKDKW